MTEILCIGSLTEVVVVGILFYLSFTSLRRWEVFVVGLLL